jgi:hypothetical protein
MCNNYPPNSFFLSILERDNLYISSFHARDSSYFSRVMGFPGKTCSVLLLTHSQYSCYSFLTVWVGQLFSQDSHILEISTNFLESLCFGSTLMLLYVAL